MAKDATLARGRDDVVFLASPFSFAAGVVPLAVGGVQPGDLVAGCRCADRAIAWTARKHAWQLPWPPSRPHRMNSARSRVAPMIRILEAPEFEFRHDIAKEAPLDG